MTPLTDHDLLAKFARSQSEEAFAGLVERHINLVHSTALRFAGNAEHAADITQSVFIFLARQAGRVPRDAPLSAWLYQTTRWTSANFMRAELRRHRREQELCEQPRSYNPDPLAWEDVAPWLDEAMGGLGASERAAVVLRFFENQSARDVAGALNASEAAVRKQLSRALEKLRRHFRKRGVASTAAAGLLNGLWKYLAWLNAKTALAIGAGALLAATVGANLPAGQKLEGTPLDERVKKFLADPPPFLDAFYTMTEMKNGEPLPLPVLPFHFFRIIYDGKDSFAILNAATNLVDANLLDCWECYHELRGKTKNVYWHKKQWTLGLWTNTTAELDPKNLNSIARAILSAEGNHLSDIMNLGPKFVPVGRKTWDGNSYTATDKQNQQKTVVAFQTDSNGRPKSALMQRWSTQNPSQLKRSNEIEYSYSDTPVSSELPFLPATIRVFYPANDLGAPGEVEEYHLLYASTTPSEDKRFSAGIPTPAEFPDLWMVETISNDFKILAPAPGTNIPRGFVTVSPDNSRAGVPPAPARKGFLALALVILIVPAASAWSCHRRTKATKEGL